MIIYAVCVPRTNLYNNASSLYSVALILSNSSGSSPAPSVVIKSLAEWALEDLIPSRWLSEPGKRLQHGVRWPICWILAEHGSQNNLTVLAEILVNRQFRVDDSPAPVAGPFIAGVTVIMQ